MAEAPGPPKPLTCAYGEPCGPGLPHPLCEAATERAVTEFWLAVSRGEWNGRGYTPAEWKAKLKREKEQRDRA